MAKGIFVSLVIVLFLFPLAAAHEEVLPKTTPDRPFYGLSVALDKINLALTFDKRMKTNKGLIIAHERLLEIEAMREAGKLDKAQRSADNYAATMGTVAASVERLKAETPQDAEVLADAEAGLAELEGQADGAANALSAEKETDGLESEKLNRIEKINEKISAHKKAIEKLEARKAKVKEKVPEEKLKEIEKKNEKLAEREAKAQAEINKADEEIMKAELEAGKLAQGEKAIANARKHLQMARDAFTEKKFGEAFGHANAAYHIAKAINKRVEQITIKAEKPVSRAENKSSDDESGNPRQKADKAGK